MVPGKRGFFCACLPIWAYSAPAAKGTRMNWERIQVNWKHFKGNAKRHWVKLSEEELEVIAGNRERLAEKIRQVYGVSREIAEKQLASWQDAQKESSPFK
jgi:uncharacterized protein YjbJ (UPF0337 family)